MAATEPLAAPNPPSTEPTHAPLLEVGTPVEVRTKLDNRRWARGFSVAAADAEGYRLRRESDGEVMPVAFDPDDVRAERKRGTWWY